MQNIENEIILAIVIGSTTFLLIAFFFILLVILYQKRLSQKQIELFKAVIHTQENERQRIARDLHDELGPLLSAIKLQLEMLKLPDVTKKEQDNAISSSQSMLDKAVREIRNTSYDLMPASLEKQGLIEALEERCNMISKAQQLQIKLNAPYYPPDLNRSSELNIYRILHEVINNTIKHSKATRLIIDIQMKGRQMHISCADNGVGFSMQTPEKKQNGIGIKNIQSRVKLLNGQLKIDSRPDKGTYINMAFETEKLK